MQFLEKLKNAIKNFDADEAELLMCEIEKFRRNNGKLSFEEEKLWLELDDMVEDVFHCCNGSDSCSECG